MTRLRLASTLIGLVAIGTVGLPAVATADDAPAPSSLMAGDALVAETDHATLESGGFILSVNAGYLDLGEGITYGSDDGTFSSTVGTYTWLAEDPSGRIQPRHGHSRLVLRHNGDLVLETADGRRMWHSGTRGSGAVRLTLHSGGNLALHTTSGKVVWASHTGRALLAGGMGLGPGERLRTAQDAYLDPRLVITLTMQRDGNLVRRCGKKVDWQTHTHVRGSSLRMYNNGALRVVGPNGRVLWTSGSGGHHHYAVFDGTRMTIGADKYLKDIWYAHVRGECLY